MSTAADIAVVAGPAVTALIGAYGGARWQARSKADEELRGVLDAATEELEHLAEATAHARSRYLTEGAVGTNAEGREALGNLEIQAAKNRALRDRILIRTKRGSPIYVYYLNALLANGREVAVYRTAALWPNDQAEHFDQADGWKRADEGARDFERERAAYLRAVQDRLGTGVLRRVLNRAKRSERSDAESTEPGTDAPDPDEA